MTEAELSAQAEQSRWQRASEAIFNRRTLAGGVALVLAFGAGRGESRDDDQEAAISRLGRELTTAEQAITGFEAQQQRISSLFSPLLPDDVLPEMISGTALQSVDSLPGWNPDYSKDNERLEEIQRSTVQVLSRPKGTNGPWVTDCTGVKVRVGDEEFVSTATHCVEWAGGPVGPVEPVPDPPHAANLTEASLEEYAIADINMRRDERTQPIAYVSGVAMGRPHGVDRDRVLMRVDRAEAGYSRLPALPMKEMAERPGFEPVVGESVAVFGLPTSSQKGVGARGVYLGRISVTSSEGLKEYDVVGSFPRPEYQDTFYYGGSGGSGITASGYMLGPLSARNTLTDNLPEGVPRTDQLVQRLDYERKLGVDTSMFPTIGLYAPNYAWEVEALVEDFDKWLVRPQMGGGHPDK